MPSIIESMGKILLSLTTDQHISLSSEISVVKSFLTSHADDTRGEWWSDEEKRSEAKRKMREASAKRWGHIHIYWILSGESQIVRSYAEAAAIVGVKKESLAARFRRAGDNAIAYQKEDVVVSMRRVPCKQN